MQRLGKNLGGYSGETIDIDAVQIDCVKAAQAHGWNIEAFHRAPKLVLGLTRRALSNPQRPSSAAAPVLRTSLADGGPASEDALRLYISTGIHGNEPAGPLAALRLLQENAWSRDLDIWLCPCLNPMGFILNRRGNAEGLDLNRQYHAPESAETVTHVAWLNRQPRFDLCLCLHEDWEADGFYLYELNPDRRPSLAETIINRVAEVCPIDRSPIIEGRPAHNGIIRPDVDPQARPQWPEAFFLLTHKTRLSYTLEVPSDFPLPVRVAALVTAVTAALGSLVS